MARWAAEAIEYAKISQAVLARELTKRLRRQIDRAAVNKMLILKETGKKKRRRISGDEMLAIEEITGYAVPTEFRQEQSALQVPLVSWITAGKLAEMGATSEELSDAPTVAVAGLDPLRKWIALKVDGSSMDRISPPESLIFVDLDEKRLVPNACYVIANEKGEATYKRYRPDPLRFEPVTFIEGHDTIYPDQEPPIVGRVRRTVLDL